MRSRPAADHILIVADRDRPDPLLDRYVRILRDLGHPASLLEVSPGDAVAVRREIRAHPGVRTGAIRGIQLLGKGLPSFRLLRLFPEEPGRSARGATDLPFGWDFGGDDLPRVRDEAVGEMAIHVNELTAALTRPEARFRQEQWVSRLFRLDDSWLENLANTRPPQVNNMLIVNADPVWSDEEFNQQVRTRYRNRYGSVTSGQTRRFAFRDVDFAKGGLLPFLEEALENATFLSLADHGNSNKIENMPPSQNGVPVLPARLPDFIEFASCSAGDWMAETEPALSVVEVALRQGCLATVAAQCLLAWNHARGYPDPNPGTNPYEQDNQNPFPMLDVWPVSPSIGHAQQQSVTGSLGLLPHSVYHDKVHLVFQVLAGHSLFGDGTLAFASQAFA